MHFVLFPHRSRPRFATWSERPPHRRGAGACRERHSWQSHGSLRCRMDCPYLVLLSTSFNWKQHLKFDIHHSVGTSKSQGTVFDTVARGWFGLGSFLEPLGVGPRGSSCWSGCRAGRSCLAPRRSCLAPKWGARSAFREFTPFLGSMYIVMSMDLFFER